MSCCKGDSSAAVADSANVGGTEVPQTRVSGMYLGVNTSAM